jgi:tellurite resistance protein
MINTLTLKPEVLHRVVCAVLEQRRPSKPPAKVSAHALMGRLPTLEQLRAGARESARETGADAEVARYFQSLLELGYLVASADGLAESERDTLASLVEYVTGAAVDHRALQLHFDELNAISDALGRPERLGRVASEFESADSRQEAISFAALVAIADGALTEPELKVLYKLGEHFSFSREEVQSLVNDVSCKIDKAFAEVSPASSL